MHHRYIGDRAFYRRILGIALPIIIQNGITNFVALLDNIMVGQIGTMPMSAVSIVNQLIFVFNLCIFGASSGAGIFTAQFHGSQDHDGIRHTFRFKVIICTLLTVASTVLFLLFGNSLISFYLRGEGSVQDVALVMDYGKDYMAVMLWGLLPFALSNAYASTLRETGETMVPMLGGVLAVFVNLGLNYVLIFGHFGAPAMGVQGAALATVISRVVELIFVGGWVHLKKANHPFIQGAYRSLYIPGSLLKTIIVKGMPLLLNEFLWSTGLAFIAQCYSTCGLDVVPAVNIANTFCNLGSVVYMSMGNAVGILMGQMLGAGHTKDEIWDSNCKLVILSVFSGIVFGGAMMALSGLFPDLYNTSEPVRHLATKLICISALMMPFQSYTNAAYFTLRSGGQTFITFLFDSCFVWSFCVPLAFILSHFVMLPILPMFLLVQGSEILKSFVGAYALSQKKWIQNLTL